MIDCAGGGEHFRGGCAIGDAILDLGALDMVSPLTGIASKALVACTEPTLNRFMAMGPAAWSALRRGLSGLLRADSPRAAELEGALGLGQLARKVLLGLLERGRSRVIHQQRLLIRNYRESDRHHLVLGIVHRTSSCLLFALKIVIYRGYYTSAVKRQLTLFRYIS